MQNPTVTQKTMHRTSSALEKAPEIDVGLKTFCTDSISQVVTPGGDNIITDLYYDHGHFESPYKALSLLSLPSPAENLNLHKPSA